MSISEKQQLIEMLRNRPVELGHWVGLDKLTDIHNKWLRWLLYSHNDMTLQGHRGSYKTTVLGVGLSEHILTAPYEKTMFFRKTSNDVEEVIRLVSRIMHSAAYGEMAKTLYGKEIVFYRDTKNEIDTNLGKHVGGSSQIVGLGLGTSITGKHADLIITDDIVNINDRISRAEREKTKILYQELQNIRNRGGRFFNTGTPWHKEDAFSIMPPPVKYDCYSTGLMTDEEINNLQKSMLPSLFAANYKLIHIASEDVIFTAPKTGADPSLIEQAKHCHIDASYGGEDYTAFTICKKAGETYYVFGKLWHKHVAECEQEIITLRRGFNAGKIYCETNADKGYLAKELREMGERVAPYHEDTNKFLKITSYLRGVWSNVVFVAGTDPEYITMITDYNENAPHDDAPDSLASLVRILWGKKEDTGQSYKEFM